MVDRPLHVAFTETLNKPVGEQQRVPGGVLLAVVDEDAQTAGGQGYTYAAYLARVYDLLVARFHLQEWEQSIQRKLEVAEGIYQAVADQAATYRTEFLEVIVIVLILLEIVLALFHR